MRFSPNELRDRALAAIEEAAASAWAGETVPKSKALAFALAYLSNGAKERWPFDAFWKEVTSPPPGDRGHRDFGRTQSITAAVNGIYHQLEVKRP